MAIDIEAELKVCRDAEPGPYLNAGPSDHIKGNTIVCGKHKFAICGVYGRGNRLMPDQPGTISKNARYIATAMTNYPVALKQLQAIKELCQKYNHAGCNTATHELAGKVLAIINGQVVTVEGER
jgi:hypothetical protein